MGIESDLSAIESQWQWASGGISRAGAVDDQGNALANRAAAIEGNMGKVADLMRQMQMLEENGLPSLVKEIDDLNETVRMLKESFEGGADAIRQRFESIEQKLG